MAETKQAGHQVKSNYGRNHKAMKQDHKTDPDLLRFIQAWENLTYWQKKSIYARVMFAAMRARAARWVWTRLPQ